MINGETYSLLKKFLDNGTFEGIDKIHAERACLQYKEAQHDACCSLKGRKAPAPY